MKLIKETDTDFWEKVNYKVPDLPGEEWRTIPGWELYMVSNKCRVKRTLQERFYPGGRSLFLQEELLTPYITPDGRPTIILTKFGKRKKYYIYRLMMDAFEIPYEHPEDILVNHKDQDPSNNDFSNLARSSVKNNNNWGTRNKLLSESLKRYNAGLSAEEKSERGKRAGMARAKKIICAGVVYESLADFCRKNNVKNSTAWQWLNGGNAMPEEYREKRLSYVTNEESKGNNNETERTTNDIKN